MSDKIVIRNSYSHRVSTVKKSNGHSILRIIAYIMARKLENNLTGSEHNFSHKSGVINTGFFMPYGIKTEMNEEQFYNHIERIIVTHLQTLLHIVLFLLYRQNYHKKNK